MKTSLRIRALLFISLGVIIVFKNYVIVIGQTVRPAASAEASSDDVELAIATVNKLFAEMAASNPAGIIGVHTPESQLVALFKQKNGKSVVKTFDGDAFSKMFADKSKVMNERMYAPEAKIFGDLAMVWGRYVFFANGKLTHCGVNSFHLVRTDAGWKIAGGSSTIDPGGCTDPEKAMKLTTVSEA